MPSGNLTEQALPAFFEPKWDHTTVAFGAALIVLSGLHYYNLRKRDVSVPAIGGSGRLASYYGAFKFLFNARAMLQEGYAKYRGETFKIPMFDHWIVVVSKPELIDEVRKARDDKLSFYAAVDESIAPEYTLGHYVAEDQFHAEVIRSQLTRNIGGLFDEITDEIENGFKDCITLEGSEWKAFPALKTMMQIVCRTSNRVFVGLPLCRDEDYVDLNINFTVDVAKASRLIGLFPTFMRSIAGNIFTSLPKSTRRALNHLQPLIKAHLDYEANGSHSGVPDRPNDLLTWLIDAAKGEQKTIVALTQRMLSVNFAAIHTTSMGFTQALFYLVTYPEYIQPLREEVESAVEQNGWSKLAVQKMKKLDSFMKESLRVNGLGLLSLRRKVLANYTLSDGTYLPKGTHILSNAVSVHHEAANYPNPNEFDGFRFARVQEDMDGESARNQFAMTSNDYLTFGLGRHTCPGRFFAANEMKVMMAYLIMHYDVKLEDGETERPKNFEIGPIVIPNPKAKVMFRKRQS